MQRSIITTKNDPIKADWVIIVTKLNSIILQRVNISILLKILRQLYAAINVDESQSFDG